MGRYRIQQNTNQTTASKNQKNRQNTFFGSILVKTNTNYYQQNLIGQKNQPIRSSDIHKFQENIRNKPHHQEYRNKDKNISWMLLNATKSTTNTIPLTRRRKNVTGPAYKIRTIGKIRNN